MLHLQARPEFKVLYLVQGQNSQNIPDWYKGMKDVIYLSDQEKKPGLLPSVLINMLSYFSKIFIASYHVMCYRSTALPRC